MADTIDLVPEFEDESDDDFMRRLREEKKKVEPYGTVDPDAPIFETKEGSRRRKEGEKKQKEQDRKKEKEARLEQKIEAQNRRQRLQEELRASRERSRQARADAISGRVQAYSMGAAIGFPGYIFGSVADALYLRPQEEEATNQEKKYQEDLKAYEDTIKKREIERKLEATRAQREGRPPVPPGPPPVRPTAPTATPAGFQDMAKGSSAAVAAIYAAQAVNKSIEQAAQNLTRTFTAKDVTSGIKSRIELGQRVADPLGVNIPLQVVVQGFNVLLDTNKEMLSVIKAREAFAPQTLEADVQGELLKLATEIKVAGQLDKIGAQLVRANAQAEAAWTEFQAEIMEAIGPQIVFLLKTLTTGLKTGTTILDTINNIPSWQVAAMSPLLGAVHAIIKHLQDQDIKELDNSDILNQLERFFDVNLTIGKSRPGTIPNI